MTEWNAHDIVRMYLRTSVWMHETEAWLRVREHIGIVKSDNVRCLEVGVRVGLFLVLAVGDLHMQLCRADRSNIGCVGVRDANTIRYNQEKKWSTKVSL